MLNNFLDDVAATISRNKKLNGIDFQNLSRRGAVFKL